MKINENIASIFIDYIHRNCIFLQSTYKIPYVWYLLHFIIFNDNICIC